LSGSPDSSLFAADPERQSAQEAAHVAFFGASGPKCAPAPLSPDSSPMWITPPERLTEFLTFSHRIPHFSGQRLTDFLTFGANLHCTSKSYNSQKRRSLKEKEEALRLVHNGDKTPSTTFTTSPFNPTLARCSERIWLSSEQCKRTGRCFSPNRQSWQEGRIQSAIKGRRFKDEAFR
jgi:hypothetical protein